MRRWPDRPVEQRTLFNAAFLATLVAEAAAGHLAESDTPLPFALAFLSAPIVLHEPTREALPTLSTSMFAWLDSHQAALVAVPGFAHQLVPFLREGISFGATHGALEFSGAGLVAAAPLARARRHSQTAETRRCRDRSRFVGRWFARAGDPGTILAAWGLTV